MRKSVKQKKSNPCMCNHSMVVVLKTGMYREEMTAEHACALFALERLNRLLHVTCSVVLTPHSILHVIICPTCILAA